MSLLGERLRQARQARGIAQLQVGMDTRIRAAMIQALEEGNYAALPPEPFLRGLIRTYATYLGLDSEEMLALYRTDRTPPPVRPAPGTRPESPTQITRSDLPIPSQESATPSTSLPSTEAVRKPTAIRLPSLRPPLPRPPARKPSLPEPSLPPEALTPPEALAAASPLLVDSALEPTSRAHLTRPPMPWGVILAILGGILCLCLVFGVIVFAQFSPMIVQLVGLNPGTPTRVPPTRTPTLRPGIIPTAIPTLAATAPPFPSFPGSPTATIKGTPHPAVETFSGLNLDVVEVTQTVTLHIGVDGILVFSGAMQPGTTRSWSAKDSLYVQIENPKGAILELNGSTKWFAPRNFAETRSLERQWDLNDKGTPMPVTPVTPATLPATTPVIIPSLAPRGSPTPTLTPFS